MRTNLNKAVYIIEANESYYLLIKETVLEAIEATMGIEDQLRLGWAGTGIRNSLTVLSTNLDTSWGDRYSPIEVPDGYQARSFDLWDGDGKYITLNQLTDFYEYLYETLEKWLTKETIEYLEAIHEPTWTTIL